MRAPDPLISLRTSRRGVFAARQVQTRVGRGGWGGNGLSRWGLLVAPSPSSRPFSRLFAPRTPAPSRTEPTAGVETDDLRRIRSGGPPRGNGSQKQRSLRLVVETALIQ